MVLLPNNSKETSTKIAKKIKNLVESLSISSLDKKELNFTVSIGVTQIDIQKDEDIQSSMKRADDALYEAENSVRNKVCVC